MTGHRVRAVVPGRCVVCGITYLPPMWIVRVTLGRFAHVDCCDPPALVREPA